MRRSETGESREGAAQISLPTLLTQAFAFMSFAEPFAFVSFAEPFASFVFQTVRATVL
jgi:hypothetical protein